MTASPQHTTQLPDADVALIGAGIMSATLSSMLTLLDPDLRILILERAEDIAGESSDPWNNAGTGHSGYCELNYMPDPTDGTKPAEIAGQFHLTRQWWAHLVRLGLLDPSEFIHSAPHMNLVFGEADVSYLRRRVETLSADPLLSEMEYSEDPATIARWAPLTMEGRADTDEPLAAARHPRGTDVDFGALTEALLRIGTTEVRSGHTVTGLNPSTSGWTVSGSTSTGPFAVHAKTVFVGAGGFALRLLQKAQIPEVRGYAVLPVGAAFYRCSTPAVAARHEAKVYGQADVGAPPMSVPHLDRRVVDGKEHLLFGPYATFSTKLLRQGRLSDFFTTVRPDNLHVIAAAGLQNLSLVSFLIKELAAGPSRKFAQLRRYFPLARRNEWTLLPAGQRAQLVKPDPKRIGALQQGTELVVSADGSVAGLLGASPGASTAVPIMFDLLEQAFPAQWHDGWRSQIAEAVPDLDRSDWTAEAVDRSHSQTDAVLGLSQASFG
ncbi:MULTISPECIES: malate:quinone oxidoreductase [unclassified Brevibacterium]|uniref:malate:quinone oxidoreductase n=1 Tax=unclassified Brevibacterium TaxID=2614124 RepID=UPI0010920170|nr:malate:quinone oxidoreductase [Brevibacterium sp. S22]TGD33263.1 malate:quinone oxidoreductase [Brevibacterium sp. S22]